MPTIEQNKRYKILLGQDNNALTWLIIMNAVAFVTLILIKIIYVVSYDGFSIAIQLFHRHITDYVYVPAAFSEAISRPWTFALYMFSHENIWHFISSLLWLWCFGYILQDLAGNNKLAPLYIYGGITGVVFYLIGTNLLPNMGSGNLQPLMGAGTSIVAIAVATTTLSPNYKIFPLLNGGIPLWVLTLIFLAIDFATVASTNGGFALAHIASGFIGFFFIQQLKQGRDWSVWMFRFGQWFDGIFSTARKHSRKNVREEHFYKATRKPYEKTPHITQQKIDDLLDKINQQGYSHLTEEEKEFLNKASKEEF